MKAIQVAKDTYRVTIENGDRLDRVTIYKGPTFSQNVLTTSPMLLYNDLTYLSVVDKSK